MQVEKAFFRFFLSLFRLNFNKKRALLLKKLWLKEDYNYNVTDYTNGYFFIVKACNCNF